MIVVTDVRRPGSSGRAADRWPARPTREYSMTRTTRPFARRVQAAVLIPTVALSSYFIVSSEPVGTALASDRHGMVSAQAERQVPSRLLGHRPEPFWTHPSGTAPTVTATPTATATAGPAVTAVPAPADPTTSAPATQSPRATAKATPPPAPAPAPVPAVPAKPVSPAGRPGASNTGVPAGTTLTPSGELRITTANQVIDGLDITGPVTVEAPGVVIENSRIHGDDVYGVLVRTG